MDELGPMFDIYSSGPRLPWLWIIEYLSSFPQIDTSIIRGLIETAPVLPGDLGENTSERIALRCLEEIFSLKKGLENVAPPDSRIAFDLSSSCDDVMEQILQEVPLSNLKKAGPELLRWDAQPFITHKRASLPKCALEQLKGSILEQIRVLDGEENEPASRFDNSDYENGNQQGNLIPQITKNDNEVLQDGLLEKNLQPSKMFRNDSVSGNLVGPVIVNQDSMHNDLHLNAKKFKQDATCTTQTVEQIPSRSHSEGQVEDESKIIIEVTEIEGNNLRNDSQVGEGEQDTHVASRTRKDSQAGMGDQDVHVASRTIKDSQAGMGDQDVHVASRTLEQSNAVSHVELQENHMDNVQNADADVMVEQKYGDRECQNVLMDESNNVENGALPKSLSGDACENIDQGFPLSSPNSTSADGLQLNIDPDQAKADVEHPFAEQICENKDERLNIALEKNLFLTTQCKPSQDLVGKAGRTEQNLCVKCNQYGQMLVCNSSDCSLVVHQSCLDSAARFDDKDTFYCPFCAYSLSISEYLEAKDKTLLARKDVATFMKLCSKKSEELRKLGVIQD